MRRTNSRRATGVRSCIARQSTALCTQARSSSSGAWAEFAGAAEPLGQIDTYRQFALEHSGSAKAGEQLFLTEKKLACTNCHRITGAEKSGPNLDGIADKYSRRDLIENILKPSLSIKPGYEQSTVITRDGRSIVGRITRLQKSMVKLINAEGKTIDILGDRYRGNAPIARLDDAREPGIFRLAAAILRPGLLPRNIALRGGHGFSWT